MHVPMASLGSHASTEKVRGSKGQTRLMNVFVYHVTDSLFNSCNEEAADSLLWVEAGDLDTFFPAVHGEAAGTMREKSTTKLTDFLSGETVIIPEEYQFQSVVEFGSVLLSLRLTGGIRGIKNVRGCFWFSF